MKASIYKFSSSRCAVYFNGSFDALKILANDTRTILVTDENVHAAHSKKFSSWDTIVLKAGEIYKVQNTADAVIRQLIEMEADRETLLIGVGGGVITDLTGYIATVFLRGIRFGLVPSSLLAMVDAAIGGKNGIDVDGYKNMVGTIRQPEFIVFDPELLRSLPDAEWKNGMAEVIKHACLGGTRAFNELENTSLAELKKNKELLRAVVEKNARFKLNLVRRDEFESGPRKILNFGHTLGHALEKQYEISHGEAVAIGMNAAVVFSEKILGFHSAARVEMLITKFGLPASALFNPAKIFQVMIADKKRRGNRLDYVLLKDFGKPVIQTVSLAQMKNLLQLL